MSDTNIKSSLKSLRFNHASDNNCSCHGDHQGNIEKDSSLNKEKSKWKEYFPTTFSFSLLVAGIVFDYFDLSFFKGLFPFIWYTAAYIPVGGKVVIQSFQSLRKGDIFNEFFLMTLASLGAFYLREYAEGVSVMLFYVVGEHFQELAVLKSRRSIKDLIDNRPKLVSSLNKGQYQQVDPKCLNIGDTVQLKAGEKVALDGELLSESSVFNTSALTGESVPQTKTRGERILAGMINLDKVVEMKVSASFENSALSNILKLVERATARKAKTQQFISRFAKVYTPIVVFLALAIVIFPYFITSNYSFNDWLYRALVFLVVSCPCALVVSIPLGYFGGIGAASRNGILFKGSSFLDELPNVDTIIFDKTGTLTEGVFAVQEVNEVGIEKQDLMLKVASLENKSNHPIAKAIVKSLSIHTPLKQASQVEEIAGMGIKGMVENKLVLAGNTRLLQRFNISYPNTLDSLTQTLVAVAIEGKFSGYIVLGDQIKEDVFPLIKTLKEQFNKELVILSGDKTSVVVEVATALGVESAYGNLLPQDKVAKIEELKQLGKKIAFIGDGINDAPSIALADIGIAMGGLGSDAAIETADVVIQSDKPSQLITAIKISQATKRIVWQNIGLSFLVKVLVILLGAGGLAYLWEAIFADVGVALLAILNAYRIQLTSFNK